MPLRLSEGMGDQITVCQERLMAKLGEYEFPEIGLSESIELGKKIVREFAGEVFTRLWNAWGGHAAWNRAG